MDKNDHRINFKALLEQSVEYHGIIENLQNGIVPTAVFGLVWPAFIFNILALLEDRKKLVVIVENESEAQKLADEISQHDSAVYIIPKLELTFFDAYSHSHQVEYARLESLYALLEQREGLFIMAVDSMFHPLNQPADYRDNTLQYSVGEQVERDDFLARLVELGYQREEVVDAKGQFAVRGGIVDIYMPRYQQPVRLEFFGDEIDSIRLFALETQLSSENINSFTLRPCREGLVFANQHQAAHDHLTKLMAKDNHVILKRALDDLQSGLHVDEAYKRLPLYIQDYATIFDYIGDTTTLIWGYNRIIARNNNRYDDWLARFEMHLDRAEVCPQQIALSLPPDMWQQGIQRANTLIFSGLKTPIKDLKLSAIIDYHFREASIYHGQLDMAAADIEHWAKLDYAIWIMVEGAEKLAGVQRFLADYQLTQYQESGVITLHDRRLSAGFSTDSFKAVLLTEAELYGEKQSRRKVKVKHARAIKTFSDLSAGDYVVHDQHGIGRYQGVFQLTVDGQKKDFLKITYKADDVLYVPVEKMEILQKYIGAEVKNVKLSRMGSPEWKNTKQKVKRAIEDMTDELVALYATRQAQRGHAFSTDNDWQRQFEDSFPYAETDDQLKCIREIKVDMEGIRPMDRLLCGDVGYGKTEVAMRAVFKAVNDSKQVAILVPTTILAQQHYDTLVHRFSKYPVTIGVLSRFRTRAEIKKTIDDLRTGVVDIVVGTHRLLSKDVHFKDLGLLVVDEEQRFGVKHKERIKQLKTNIDVLTLSATPIPRTLHMSLVGIRDLSTIEDPPEDRYPIQTYVLDYQPVAIREAILREIDRRGQVYFVHNRVEDIDQVSARLSQLVPEARIAYAHGKMRETELEQRMYDFMNGEFDVLVSTTIVETGLDIANVNTMIINQADRFGLSQLYQLRGRVGRSNRLAYAYLIHARDKVLSEIAEKRLKAIKEFTDLGSGFKIAMRDLELRGAGSLLGAQQHGHLASVGYEMYCKLLEDAVREAKGETVSTPIDSTIEIPCQAYIPEYYIANAKFKLDLYKRISAIRDQADRRAIEMDIVDLYGDAPQSVLNLIAIGYIRAMAVKHGFESVGLKGDDIALSYSLETKVNPLLISMVLDSYNGKGLKFIGSQQSYFLLRVRSARGDERALLACVIELLDRLDDFQNRILEDENN